MKKERLDILLVERGLCASREQAQARIMAGEVWSSEQRLEKSGTRVPFDIPLEIRAVGETFTSRGGYKLAHALKTFGISVKERVCIDIGASTGGFTDCLLKEGASTVFAVDVGYGQLDQKLRQDCRVINVERTNARHLTLNELTTLSPKARDISVLVADVSFISLFKLIEPLTKQFSSCRDWILLFKPQFEVGPENLSKGGVVKNTAATKKALDDFEAKMKELGFTRSGNVEPSPITGKKSGNTEYLLYYIGKTT